MSLSPVGFDRLPGWQQDRSALALAPFLVGCARMGTDPLGGIGDTASLGGSPDRWRPACNAASRVPQDDDAAARAFFETWFQPYAILNNGSADGLFTGYYEPEVRGARSPGAGYTVPLLARPADLVAVDLTEFLDPFLSQQVVGRVQNGQLVPTSAETPAAVGRQAPSLVHVDLTQFPDAVKTRRVVGRVQAGELVPYYDRSEIEGGALVGKRLELLWLDDRIDAFFLHIQGAGRVELPDHRVVRVSFAGQNGRTYVPIGRVLADRGEIKLEDVSMQSIRAWLTSHPAEAGALMDSNPSYVFFRETNGARPDEGPPGALGAPLTPGRSIAVDRGFIPLGAPVWVDTTDPVDGSKLQRLMLAQDLGGAIRGPVRADIFFGWGKDAESRAGLMRKPGQQYVLLPKAPASQP